MPGPNSCYFIALCQRRFARQTPFNTRPLHLAASVSPGTDRVVSDVAGLDGESKMNAGAAIVHFYSRQHPRAEDRADEARDRADEARDRADEARADVALLLVHRRRLPYRGETRESESSRSSSGMT